MKSNYEVRAKKFISLLFPYIEAGLCYKKNLKKSYIKTGVKVFLSAHSNRKVIIADGISRIALITSDYVIKIDYNFDSGFGCCESELDNYYFACDCGYQDYFAKITPYIYHGYTFYIMPKISNIDEDRDDVYSYCDEEVSDWLKENFFDLHSGNFGFKNGHPVIFDYAARNEW